MWGLPCWYRYWVMLYIKTCIYLNHRWNNSHFLCFLFLCKRLVILWTRHKSGINLCHCTAACICTPCFMNIAMIPVGFLISTPLSCASVVQGKTMCQDVPRDCQGGSLGSAERRLLPVGYWYTVRLKTQSETFPKAFFTFSLHIYFIT